MDYKRSLRQISYYAPPIVLIMAIIGIWQFATYEFKIPVYLLPGPVAIWKALTQSNINWSREFLATLYEVLTGFFLAVAVSIPLAIVLVYSKWFNRAVYPIILALQILPKVAIAPLLFILLGFNDTPRILVVFLISFFPIIIDTVTGLNALDPNHVELMRSLGASNFQIFGMARFRNGLPFIYSGLKVSITLALVGAVVAEFVQANNGLGFVLIAELTQIGTATAFAALTLLTLMGIMLYIVVLVLEAITIPWYAKSKQVGG